MTKVVYNACYGEFGLSKEACQRYWDIKGQQVWIEDGRGGGGFTVWLIPPEERLEKKHWSSMTMDEHIAYNLASSKQIWYNKNVDRHDPVLVQVVEELGEKANGNFADLRIDEVYGSYRIDDHNGNERIMTSDDYN